MSRIENQSPPQALPTAGEILKKNKCIHNAYFYTSLALGVITGVGLLIGGLAFAFCVMPAIAPAVPFVAFTVSLVVASISFFISRKVHACRQNKISNPSPFPSLINNIANVANVAKPKEPVLVNTLTQQERESFAAIKSEELQTLPTTFDIENPRACFSELKGQRHPVISRQISWIPQSLHEHLLKDKRPLALGEKWLPKNPKTGEKATSITNAEAIFTTMVPEITQITIAGDPTGYLEQLTSVNGNHFQSRYVHDYNTYELDPSQPPLARQVILSNVPTLDFECSGSDNSGRGEVIMKIARVSDSEIEGKQLSQDFTPLSRRENVDFEKALPEYEETLKQHLIYHLTADKRLSPKHMKIKSFNEGIEWLERLMRTDYKFNSAKFKNKSICLSSNDTLSLEVIFNLYVKQIESEFSILNELLPQGYIYTIDPAVIFTTAIDGKEIGGKLLNRMQISAFQYLNQTRPELFSNMKILAFNDFADQEAVSLLQRIKFKSVDVMKKEDLLRSVYTVGGGSTINRRYFNLGGENSSYALVLHNNGDAFGQNIEHEDKSSSLDGLIGYSSDASYHLHLQEGNRVFLSFTD